MGSLIGVILGGVLLSTIVASGTSWYLSMRNNLGNTEDKLEAQTIAMSEWERLSHMSLDELEAKRGELAEKYSAGTGSQYEISVNLGEKGTFNGGTCGNVGSDGYANCFKNTTITVYRDGNRMFTTRTLPLMAGDYTRREIDNLLADIKNDYNNKINTEATARANKDTDLQNQINSLKKSLQDEYYKKTEIDRKIDNSGACKIISVGKITSYSGSNSGHEHPTSKTFSAITFSCPSGFEYFLDKRVGKRTNVMIGVDLANVS